MPILHVVEQGECIASIAAAFGMDPNQIWTAPENAELRAARPLQNILFPGDSVVVKDKEIREEPGATEARHRFKKKGAPIRLRIRFRDADKPRAGLEYLLLVGPLKFTGKTDDDGGIDHPIPPDAVEATLRIGGQDSGEDYLLKIGALDPIKEISGIQARLHNLGFTCGEIDGILGPETKRALREFQHRYDLPVTGEPDGQTEDELKRQYGS